MAEGRDHSERVRYRFPPLERRGVVAGWRGGQIAIVAAGLILGVLALRSNPSVAGILVTVVSVATAVAFAFWPVLGRTGEQWLPLVARWMWARWSGGGRQHAPGPRSGHRIAVDPSGSTSGPAPASGGYTVLPPVVHGRHRARRSVFGGLRLEGLPFGTAGSPGEAGVLFDGPSRTATAVLAVKGHSFALLGPADQDARIAAWARVLAAMAREGSEVHRIQWIESCLPDDGSSVRRHWSTHAALGADTPAGRSYGSLVDESAPVTRRHRVLVALSIHTSHSARSIRSAGRGPAGVGAVLTREVLALHRSLDGADITVEGVLGPGALDRVISESYAPTGGAPGHPVVDTAGAALDVDPRRPSGDRRTWPWPMTVEPHWDAVRTDATWHATYWIAEWPRVDVTPDFLGPLLFSSLRRSVVMVMEPVSPSRAARQVAQARTADIADGELRRRGGFLVTARHTRERESVVDRDTELADGHAQYRYSGYVTLTADNRQDLEASRSTLEQAAGQARIELRLLFGEQDTAFACSLPLGRGLS